MHHALHDDPQNAVLRPVDRLLGLDELAEALAQGLAHVFLELLQGDQFVGVALGQRRDVALARQSPLIDPLQQRRFRGRRC